MTSDRDVAVLTIRRPEDLPTGKGKEIDVFPLKKDKKKKAAKAEPISGESSTVWLLVKNEGRQEDGEGEEECRHEGGGEN